MDPTLTRQHLDGADLGLLDGFLLAA